MKKNSFNSYLWNFFSLEKIPGFVLDIQTFPLEMLPLVLCASIAAGKKSSSLSSGRSLLRVEIVPIPELDPELSDPLSSSSSSSCSSSSDILLSESDDTTNFDGLMNRSLILWVQDFEVLSLRGVGQVHWSSVVVRLIIGDASKPCSELTSSWYNSEQSQAWREIWRKKTFAPIHPPASGKLVRSLTTGVRSNYFLLGTNSWTKLNWTREGHLLGILTNSYFLNH